MIFGVGFGTQRNGLVKRLWPCSNAVVPLSVHAAFNSCCLLQFAEVNLCRNRLAVHRLLKHLTGMIKKGLLFFPYRHWLLSSVTSSTFPCIEAHQQSSLCECCLLWGKPWGSYEVKNKGSVLYSFCLTLFLSYLLSTLHSPPSPQIPSLTQALTPMLAAGATLGGSRPGGARIGRGCEGAREALEGAGRWGT